MLLSSVECDCVLFLCWISPCCCVQWSVTVCCSCGGFHHVVEFSGV